MLTREHLEQIVGREPAVRFALLFGSRARGQARPGSDWDVALFVDPDLDVQGRFEMRRRLMSEMPAAERVDVVVLNEAPPLLAHRALQGSPLFVRDHQAYVRFAVRALALSLDEQYFRDLHARARRRRLEGGTFGRP